VSARRARRLLVASLASLAAGLAGGMTSTAAAGVTCDRYASPFGSDSGAGSETVPYRTPQQLANSLAPGQTGCLVSGTYSQEVTGPYVLRIARGGAPGAPITIRSVPGQRATLRGIVYVVEGADFVTLSNLDIDGRRPTPDETVSVQVMGEDTIIEDSTITNQAQAICMVLGSPGWGEAKRTVVRRNTFHDCGGRDNYLEHSVYVEWTVGVLVTDNLFLRSGAYAVHLYPYAQQTTISHNVMVDNGGGVIFAGESGAASSDNLVTQNIITGSFGRPGIHSGWGGTVGTGNLAKDNCLFNNPKTNVDVSGGGFSARDNVIASPGYRDPAAGDYRLSQAGPCLGLVGYDTVAKLLGDPVDDQAAPSPSPTPTASPAPTATSTPTPSATPASTPTSTPTASPTPTASATPPAQTPGLEATPAATMPPPGAGTAPEPEVDVEPIEAARLVVDDGAFSASGGSAATNPCKPRRSRRCQAAARR